MPLRPSMLPTPGHSVFLPFVRFCLPCGPLSTVQFLLLLARGDHAGDVGRQHVSLAGSSLESPHSLRVGQTLLGGDHSCPRPGGPHCPSYCWGCSHWKSSHLPTRFFVPFPSERFWWPLVEDMTGSCLAPFRPPSTIM